MSTVVKVRMAAGSGETFGVDDIAVAAATSLGFWQAEGIEVEWIPARGGVKALEEVLSGNVDVAYGTYAPVISARSRGEKTRVLTSMARGLAQALVVRSERVKELKDLEGARWAVDGIGALSHCMGRLVAEGAGVTPEWVVAGPPPQRINQLLEGTADCSLLRVEEATALTRDHSDTLTTLLGISDLQKLVSRQPHGVLSTTESFEQQQPEVCAKIVKGLLLASRALHDDEDVFRRAVRNHVKHVTPTDEEIHHIWQQEHDNGSFAVNTGMAAQYWQTNFDVHYHLNPEEKKVSYEEIIAPSFAKQAVDAVGAHASAFDQTP